MQMQDNVVFLYALSLAKGIGPQALVRVLATIPRLQDLPEFSLVDLQERIGLTIGERLFRLVQKNTAEWKGLLDRAVHDITIHREQGIVPLALTDPSYPALLKHIPDPPPLLYVKGNMALLHHTKAVAIVGTRDPTPGGLSVARHLAHQLAQREYSIVSGLAKGIDAAAHHGALDAGGYTIAVFATPLDTVYPAEHRALAQRILDEWGLLVSELALGQRGFRTAFVRRDRIQSGLSVAVLPIQTRNEGGTMHTVRFAYEQKRLVLCPNPLPNEAHAPQYEGIKTLIKESKEHSPSFSAKNVSYKKLLGLFQQRREELLPHSQDLQEHIAIELFPSFHPTPTPFPPVHTVLAVKTMPQGKRRRRQTVPLEASQHQLME